MTDWGFQLVQKPVVRSKVKGEFGNIYDYFQNDKKRQGHGGKYAFVQQFCK